MPFSSDQTLLYILIAGPCLLGADRSHGQVQIEPTGGH